MNMKNRVIATVAASLIAVGGLGACKTTETGQATTNVSATQAAVTATSAPLTTTQRPLSDNERFWALLDEGGITYDKEKAVDLAHTICEFRRDYPQYDAATIAENVADPTDPSFPYTLSQTKYIINVSTIVYCPFVGH